MSYYDEGAIDQFRLPIAYAFGQREVATVLVSEFERWAEARRGICGHRTHVQGCRVCHGTIKVSEAISWDQPGVRGFPEG